MKGYIVIGLVTLLVISVGVVFLNVRSPTGHAVNVKSLKVIPVEDWISGAESENAVIIDIRTKEEFEEFHVPGSVNIDFYSDSFESLLSELDRDKTYFTYCRTGRRSGVDLEAMSKLRFKSVYDLEGGIIVYREYKK